MSPTAKDRKKVTKAEVLAPIERESARLLGLVRGLGDDRAARPLVDGWSARDVVAHCVYWQGMLARMMGAPLPVPSWIPRWQSEDQVGTDELNRLTVEHYRSAPFDTVVTDFTFTAELVKRIVAEMKEENLLLEAGAPWEPGMRVFEAIAGETHGHWKEHADQLSAVLTAQGA